MNIRELHHDELWTCRVFGQDFHAEKAIPDEFNIDAFVTNWKNFYKANIGVIFGLWDDHGVLIGGAGGILAADITSGKMKMNELFWYVDKAKRHTSGRWPLRLLFRLREWGKHREATAFRMVRLLTQEETPHDGTLHRLYTNVLKMKPMDLSYEGPIGD